MMIDHRQSGTALVIALLVSFMMFGIAGSYLVLSHGGFQSSSVELGTVQARIAAEDGITLALAELKSGVDAGGDGLGSLTSTAADGRTITVTATNLGGNLFQVHSAAVLRRARAGADVVVERIPAGNLSFNARAAITAEGPVTTLGNIVVDGRDWDITGTSVVGPGGFGISSMGTITNGGNSAVGGNGIAPAKPPPAGTQEPFADWDDGVDQDADGFTDEEPFDGNDNDGDGAVDEDTSGYPDSPDVMFGFAPGTLQAAAAATGTYFTSQAAYDAMVAANGGVVPGGVIIYCDFDLWQPVELGDTFNTPPSVIVHHNATGTATMKNVHGMFKGLVLADFVVHLNGDFVLLGALMSFGDESIGNAFGNGNAKVKLCTAALSNLPSAGGSNAVRILSWSRSVAQ
jgi:hypothetical protein